MPARQPKTRKRQSVAEKGGGFPRPRAVIDKRRKQVFELYLRGMDAETIAKGLNFPARTIYRDIANIKQWLKIHFEKDRIVITNMTMAQLDLLWRDLQQAFINPIPAQGPDPAYRKAMLIDRMLKVLQVRSNLTQTIPAPSTGMPPTWRGVEITSSTRIDDIVREGGVAYAAIHQPATGNSD